MCVLNSYVIHTLDELIADILSLCVLNSYVIHTLDELVADDYRISVFPR